MVKVSLYFTGKKIAGKCPTFREIPTDKTEPMEVEIPFYRHM